MQSEYFLSINDVSRKLDLPAHTLRYWEKQFPAAIKPTTGAGGRRYYRPETVDTLAAIQDQLYNRGMTIAGVKKLLKEGCLTPQAHGLAANADAHADNLYHPQSAIADSPPSRWGQSAEISRAIDLLETAKKELKN